MDDKGTKLEANPPRDPAGIEEAVLEVEDWTTSPGLIGGKRANSLCLQN